MTRTSSSCGESGLLGVGIGDFGALADGAIKDSCGFSTAVEGAGSSRFCRSSVSAFSGIDGGGEDSNMTGRIFFVSGMDGIIPQYYPFCTIARNDVKYTHAHTRTHNSWRPMGQRHAP